MSKKKKIGIYGGTFNPPHLAHFNACKAFYDFVKPDELLVIPDYLPPHKEIDSFVTTEQRLEMTRLAFESFPFANVTDMEIKRGGKSFTAVTLSELKNEENELYFLCGTDMFLTLDSWYRPDVIFSLATICYVRRENDKENDAKLEEMTAYYKEKYKADILPITSEVTELSSSEIRQKIKLGECVDSLLQESVKDYILSRGLYK